MNLSAAPERAQSIRSSGAAAKLYNSIEYELGYGLYTEDESDAGDHAKATLRARFPGIEDAARNVTEPPELSRGAHKTLRESSSEPPLGRDAEGAGEEPAPRPRPSSSRSSIAPQRSRSGSSSRARRGGPSLRDVTGVSGSDVTDTVLTGLRWLLVAGIAYQLFQPKGSAAFSGVLGGIGKGISLVVDPVDPLAGSKVQQGFDAAQQAVTQASANAPGGTGGNFDTPTGTAPFAPPTFGAPNGTFDTPGGTAPFRTPTNIPGLVVTGPPASGGKGPASPFQLPKFTLPNLL